MNDYPDVDREVQKMMAELKENQDRFTQTQREIEATEIVGSAERGAVTVTMNGGGRFTQVNIEDDAVRRFPAHMLGGIVLEAITDAMRQLAGLTKERFAPFMEDPSILDDAVTYYREPDAGQLRQHP
ncbi:MAG: YbaB/EbfC family nucleoid-associated protein [Phycicoccus sp.]